MYESFVCRLRIIKISLVNNVLFSKIKVFATRKKTFINQPNRMKRILLLLVLMTSMLTIHTQTPTKGGE